MRLSRTFRLIALVVFVAALCASVAPLCFDSIDCVHGCQHGSRAMGTHSASVGMMGLIVMGVTAIAAMSFGSVHDDRRHGRHRVCVAAATSTRTVMAVPLRI